MLHKVIKYNNIISGVHTIDVAKKDQILPCSYLGKRLIENWYSPIICYLFETGSVKMPNKYIIGRNLCGYRFLRIFTKFRKNKYSQNVQILAIRKNKYT